MLPGAAAEIDVQIMASAAETLGVQPVEQLVTREQVDLAVVVRAVHVHVYAAEGIGDGFEGGEVHGDVVVEVHAQPVLDGADEEGAAAVGIGRVDLAMAVALDLRTKVARHRQERKKALFRVDMDQDDDVRASFGDLGTPRGPLVVAKEDDVHGGGALKRRGGGRVSGSCGRRARGGRLSAGESGGGACARGGGGGFLLERRDDARVDAGVGRAYLLMEPEVEAAAQGEHHNDDAHDAPEHYPLPPPPHAPALPTTCACTSPPLCNADRP